MLKRLRRWRGPKAVLAVLGAAVFLLIGGAGTASAHAALVSTDPAQNSVVPTAPAAVTLTFSEGVSLASDSVRVLGPTGKAVDAGNPGHADGKADTARVELTGGLPNGTYTVAWRAVSEDSHPVGGAFTFSIGAPSGTTVSAANLQGAEADSLVAAVYGTGRVVAYAAFALLAGVAAFVILCWPEGATVAKVQRLLMSGWVALLVSTVAVLLLRGPYERGSGIGQALDLTLVRSTLEERIGTALSARLLLLAAAGVFLSLLVGQLGQERPAAEPGVPGRSGNEGSGDANEGSGDAEEDELRLLEQRAADRPLRDARVGLGVAGLVLSVALSATWVGADHASVGIQVWLALPAGILHLLAMALWLGGLATLLVGLRNGLEAAAVELFSKLAFGAVAVLVVTGVYQSWRGLGSWGALTDTEYGRLLLIKTGCVVAMVGVAWISRSWVARLRTAPATAAAPAAEAGVPVAEAAPAVEAGVPVVEAALAVEVGVPAVEAAAPVTADTADPVRRAPPAHAGLRRSVLVETAVAVAVLVVTTMLTNSPPGRVAQSLAATPQSPAASGAPGASTAPGRTVELKLPYNTGGKAPGSKGTATVTLNPAAAGGNTVQLALDDESGKPITVPEVQLAFTLPDRDLGPLPVALKAAGTGRWSGTAQLPLAGDWVVSVTVRSSDIDQTTEVKPVKIG